MDDAKIFKEFQAADAILTGHFILTSGLHSDTYLQCARVLMDASRAELLCAELARRVKAEFGENAFDLIVSPAMGGVVVGYEMGRQLGLPAIFCERVDGRFTLRRGFRIEEGARVLVVEDVVTTGKSSVETFACIKEHGGMVRAEAALIDRSCGESKLLGVPLFTLLQLTIPVYPADRLPTHLQNVPAIKPGSRWIGDKGGKG